MDGKFVVATMLFVLAYALILFLAASASIKDKQDEFTTRISLAMRLGYDDFMSARGFLNNRYDRGTPEFTAWQHGWLLAMREHASDKV